MEDIREVVSILKKGGVGVLPTDTLYGLVGSALMKNTVMRIYRLRRRDLKKPMIVLIGSLKDLDRFRVRDAPPIKKMLAKLWPGKVSIILSCPSRKFFYLHRGTKTIAFRLPASPRHMRGEPAPYDIAKLLKATGPLVAPSVNVEGKPPARSIRDARKYFGKKIDFYLDGGTKNARPSMLVRLERSKLVVLRK